MDNQIILTLLAIALAAFFINKIVKHRNKSKKLTTKEINKIKNKLKTMNPRQYEVFCANFFQLLGYNSLITKESNDGGKDLILTKLGKKYYVECKCYNKTFVSRPIAQKLVGALVGDKLPAKNGIIITSSKFTNGCIEYCKNIGIKYIDLNKTINLIETLPTEKRKNLM